MSDLYHVSSSPHVRAKDSTNRIMLYVIIALLPASLFGIYNFGFRALFIILLTIASCVASEWVFDYIIKKKSTITDLSAVVTGLLLALNLPVSLPWWQHLSHRPASTAVAAWRHVLSSSFQAVLRSLAHAVRWMSLRSGTDLSVLSAEAVHLHVRQGDRWHSLSRQ